MYTTDTFSRVPTSTDTSLDIDSAEYWDVQEKITGADGC